MSTNIISNNVHLQTIIPKTLTSKLAPEIINYFSTYFNTDVALTPFKASAIPNVILTVKGEAPAVSTTYTKLFGYFGGRPVDKSYGPLGKFQVRGLDKVVKPMFIIPKTFKNDFAGLNDRNAMADFKSYYKSSNFVVFPEFQHDVWKFERGDLGRFLHWALLSTVETRQYFAEPASSGLVSMTDDDLVTKQMTISKAQLDELRSQVLRYANIVNHYLCDIKVEGETSSHPRSVYVPSTADIKDPFSEVARLTITGPKETVRLVDRLLQVIKSEYSKKGIL